MTANAAPYASPGAGGKSRGDGAYSTRSAMDARPKYRQSVSNVDARTFASLPLLTRAIVVKANPDSSEMVRIVRYRFSRYSFSRTKSMNFDCSTGVLRLQLYAKQGIFISLMNELYLKALRRVVDSAIFKVQ